MDDEECKLIYEINGKIQKLLYNYTREQVIFACKWIFDPKIQSQKMLLTDEKGWTHEIDIPIDIKPVSTHRIPVKQKINTKNLLEKQDCYDMQKKTTDFRYKKREVKKRDCGCLDVIFHYEEE